MIVDEFQSPRVAEQYVNVATRCVFWRTNVNGFSLITIALYCVLWDQAKGHVPKLLPASKWFDIYKRVCQTPTGDQVGDRATMRDQIQELLTKLDIIISEP